MKKLFIIILFSTLAGCLFSCQNHGSNKLKRQMKSMAKTYLAEEGITKYDSLKIIQVDTITELGYAKLMYELLENMEIAYQAQYDEAARQGDAAHLDALDLYLREISRTKIDFFDLMTNDELKTKGLLLFMVTGSYFADNQPNQLMFFVNPDKKTLHTLDPFGNNLLYKDEQP